MVFQFFRISRVVGITLKGIQQVDAFKCLFDLESAFERAPSCRQLVLGFNSRLWGGFIGIKLNICRRENLVNVRSIFTMSNVKCVFTSGQIPREPDHRCAE